MKDDVLRNRNEDDFKTLSISNFRNLGIADMGIGSDKGTDLKINRCLERENIGGLVLITGPNNSGKSNVLDALEYVNNPTFKENDVPDFLKKRMYPKILMNISDGKYDSEFSSFSKIDAKYVPKPTEGFFTFLKRVYLKKSAFNYFEENSAFDTFHENHPSIYLGIYSDYEHTLHNFISLFTYNELTQERRAVLLGTIALIEILVRSDYAYFRFKEGIINALNSIAEELATGTFGSLSSNWFGPPSVVRTDFSKYGDQLKKVWKNGLENSPNEDFQIGTLLDSVPKSSFGKKFGYDLSSRIIRYKEEPVQNRDLTCSFSNINRFFISLLKAVGMDEKSYSSIYRDYKIGRKSEEEFNKALSEFNEEFNSIFNTGVLDSYTFRVSFEDRIHFKIYRGYVSLDLDKQSKTFKWVFNIYMNFLMAEKFLPGDIVLIDDFGYGVNPVNAKRILDLLRRFGKMYGVIFVIAIQNSLTAHIDNLNEIRLVVNEPDGNTWIKNDVKQTDFDICTTHWPFDKTFESG